jgi:hypothetical protein
MSLFLLTILFNMRIAKWAKEKDPNTLLHIAHKYGLGERIVKHQKNNNHVCGFTF